MSTRYSLRTLTALIIVLAFLLGLAVLLLITDLAFSVWAHLQSQPAWLLWGFVLGVVVVAFLFGRLLWRLLLPKRKTPAPATQRPPTTLSRQQLEQRIDQAKELGMDVAQARRELEALAEREELGEIHIALFGEISSGKSSLIEALLPEAQIATGVVGGTTREILYYRWDNEIGMPLVLVDMPGLNEQGGMLDNLSQQEMARSHLALYIVEGDLTAFVAVEDGE